MSLLRAQSIAHHYSGTYVLQDVQWQIGPGTRWALVGRNGAGKTTLLRILAGELQPSEGTVWRRPGLRVAVHHQMDQDLDPGLSAREAVAAGLESLAELEAEREELHRLLTTLTPDGDDAHEVLERLGHVEERYRHEGGYTIESRVERALAEIGLPESSWTLPVGALSGGQRTRLRLARLWLGDPELLLLDEPTNHLDLETTEWLEERLQQFDGAIVLIAHDRAFLDALVDRVAEVESGGVTFWQGDYTEYREQKAVAQQQAARAYTLEKRDRERIEDFIRRNIYGQKTKQAQSRRKQLARRQALVRPETEKDAADLRFFEASGTGEQVLVVRGLTRRFDDNVVLDRVDLRVTRGRKIGIVGPNGSGKSTLLRTLARSEPPEAGEIVLGSRVKPGYYDQRHEQLSSHNSVLDEVWSVLPLESQETMRTFLGRFDFRGDEVFRPVSTLSGGEKSRLALARLILTGANVLMLDEPTNHLDLGPQESLARALARFSGTLLLASHDRYLLDQVADTLWVVGDGRVEVFDGAYSEWREKREARRAEAEKATAAASERAARRAAADTSRDQAPGAERRRAAALERQHKRDLEKLEEKIAQLERRRAALTEEMADPANAMNWAKLAQLQAVAGEQDTELARLFSEWERLGSEG
ncbi:MAG: ABC-F family ATP-binding cassette domain-containing protein [Candidatus Eisenbacteria bacterium]|nr:ABC-F family ATP-binding cassette domain-containing protein [Candidatus Eisenbacteria bacterium]